MTDGIMQNTDENLGEMLGEMLRARTYDAKHLADIIGCDPRAASDYRAGRQVPRFAVALRIANELGRDILDTLLHAEAADARLEMELRDAKALVRDLEARSRARALVRQGRPTVARVRGERGAAR